MITSNSQEKIPIAPLWYADFIRLFAIRRGDLPVITSPLNKQPRRLAARRGKKDPMKISSDAPLLGSKQQEATYVEHL
jgi:hypothetical protein